MTDIMLITDTANSQLIWDGDEVNVSTLYQWATVSNPVISFDLNFHVSLHSLRTRVRHTVGCKGHDDEGEEELSSSESEDDET